MDPDFTVALAFMANLNRGDTRSADIKMAMKRSANKAEGEKLFVSLLEENGTAEKRRDT